MKSYNTSLIECYRTDSETSHADAVIARAVCFANIGQFEQAIRHLTASHLHTDSIRNARGVCLMRMGKFDDAVQLYRSLVLMPGCTWMMPDMPVIYRTNFATSLLITGRRAGCLSCLREMTERDHPSVVRLQTAISEWEQCLTWWPWMFWKIGLEPKLPVSLSFPPGDFFEPASPPRRAVNHATSTHPQLAA